MLQLPHLLARSTRCSSGGGAVFVGLLVGSEVGSTVGVEVAIGVGVAVVGSAAMVGDGTVDAGPATGRLQPASSSAVTLMLATAYPARLKLADPHP